jgi:hypothetical protein
MAAPFPLRSKKPALKKLMPTKTGLYPKRRFNKSIAVFTSTHHFTQG